MEVRSEAVPISSREPFSVGLPKSPPVHSPPPTAAMPNMRMTFSSDGSSIYKHVPPNSPPSFQGSGGGSGVTAAGVTPATEVAGLQTGFHTGRSFHSAEQPLKRKRGRPRKYGPDGSMAVVLAPVIPSSASVHPPQAPQLQNQQPQSRSHPQQPQLQPQPQQPQPQPQPQQQPQQQQSQPQQAHPQQQPQQQQPQPQQAHPQQQPQQQQPQTQEAHQPQTQSQQHQPQTESQQPQHQPRLQSQPATVSAGFPSSIATGIPGSSPPSEGAPSATVTKKPRGRPPGSGLGKKRQLGALGSPRAGFNPHVIIVKTGEDVSAKIMSFLQHGPQSVCILSANGAISNVTLHQAATSGGTITYEGRFEILSLSGSYFLSEIGGQRSRTGGLSISLAGPDGRVLGGGVAGVLTAASPVQLILGSFNADAKKEQKETPPHNPMATIGLPQGNLGPSSPTSRGTLNESSGGPGSPFNQPTIANNNGTSQGIPAVQWK